jgi:glutamyl-tRNA synthetase
LRIEDTDKNREAPGGIEFIKNALRWYGLDWDEGLDVGGDYGPYIQSQRLVIYKKYADQMIASGHAYRAYDSEERLKKMREDLSARGLPTGYDRRHRYLADDERAEYEKSGAPYVVRLAVPTEGTTTLNDAVYGEVSWENRVLEDVVLLKSDGYPTYHLAAMVDDHLMEISHVFRGEDWLPSAPIHVLIYQALGWEPPTFVHLPNMLGPDRKKFGKRNGAKDALEYGQEGFLQDAMINFLTLQGWSPKEDRDLYTRAELVERFSIEGILNRSPISDPEKLLWYNGVYIRAKSVEELTQDVLPFLQETGLVEPNPSEEKLKYIGEVVVLEQERMKTLAEAPAIADFLLLGDDDYVFEAKAVAKWFKNPQVADRLRAVSAGIAKLNVIDHDSVEAVIRAVQAEFGLEKGGEIIHPVRVAISGRTTGPGLFEIMAVLGKDRVVRRIDRALGLVPST